MDIALYVMLPKDQLLEVMTPLLSDMYSFRPFGATKVYNYIFSFYKIQISAKQHLWPTFGVGPIVPSNLLDPPVGDS